MGSAALEILGLVLCLVGWVGLILACGLPMWQVTAFLDHNIVTAQTTWKGLWMSCVVQSTGHMQCKVYDSVLALSTEGQAARALTVGAVLLALIALFVTLAGAQCTTCVAPGPAKARVALTGGALYALCGLLALVPLCWFANIVVREFYDPTVPMSQKYELGAALYIGWARSRTGPGEPSMGAPHTDSLERQAVRMDEGHPGPYPRPRPVLSDHHQPDAALCGRCAVGGPSVSFSVRCAGLTAVGLGFPPPSGRQTVAASREILDVTFNPRGPC
ncbi:claudin-5 [Tupaia chinensis]|uniref:claudin-5 n=1 Tax=Tupaia chinensis TaxID=246437 RepID=UPI0003C8EC79|nr:claudin-5 [Tupaia chinensis]